MKFEVVLKGFEQFKNFLKGINKGVKETKKLNDQFILTDKRINKMFEKKKPVVETKDSISGLKDFQKSIDKTRASMFELFGIEQLEDYHSKFKAFLSNGIKGFGSLAKTIRATIASLGPIALALGAIALVIKVIKTAFKWNIGGIMEKWKRGIGEFRAAMGKLKLATYGLFKAMAPVFKVIGNILLFILRVVTKVINAITTLSTLFAGNKQTLAGLGSYSGSGGYITNNNNNITVISNKPIDAKGAKSFQDSMNNNMFYTS